MKNTNIWQKTAFEPTFVMPSHASASADVRTLVCGVTPVVVDAPTGAVRLDAVRIKGVFGGSPAWSPPV